ncbi:MAG TPA: hypothetical protein VN446_02805 [Candidatus Acidoferrum sp.]|nr:hypothetical protein [Candidatus Acidoferrum sp.]
MADEQKSPSGYMKKLLIWGLIGLFIVMLFSFVFSPNPAAPKIKYGEFPFKLTYELNGEVKVLEDVIVCEFDGYKSLGEGGKYRKWKTSLKSGADRATLLDLRERDAFDSQGRKVLELYFFVGDAAYYMGDKKSFPVNGQNLDYVAAILINQDGNKLDDGISTYDAYEKFGLRLITWEPTEPINNIFNGK